MTGQVPARSPGTGKVPQHGLPMGRMSAGARVARVHDAGVWRAGAARKPGRAPTMQLPVPAAHTGRAPHRACNPAHAAHTLHAARRGHGRAGTPGKAAPSAASARMLLCILAIRFVTTRPVPARTSHKRNTPRRVFLTLHTQKLGPSRWQSRHPVIEPGARTIVPRCCQHEGIRVRSALFGVNPAADRRAADRGGGRVWRWCAACTPPPPCEHCCA